MLKNLFVLPVWKKGASLADRLDEMASYVRAKPERFERFVMCYREKLPNGNYKYRTLQYGCDFDQTVGMFEIGKSETLKDSER
jgi:hypothetical protein